MKAAYTVVILIIFAVKLSTQNTCHWRELDLCAATALISVQNTPVPQNEEEINQHCTYLTETMECVHNYTDKCLTPIHKEVLSLITDEPVKNLRTFCTPGSEIRTNYLKHAACLSEASIERRTCLNDVQAALETLIEKEASGKITIACCTYQRYRHCSSDIVRSKCGDETVKFLNHLIHFFVSQLPDVICTGYNPSDAKCTEALPTPGTPPKGSQSNSVISRLISTYSGN